MTGFAMTRTAAIAIPDVGSVHDRRHQQVLRIHEDMALFAFDLLSAIEARRINPPPSFLTLWLSIMVEVDFASRPAC